MPSKHIPIRTCIACRTTGDKRGLMRLVRRPDGVIMSDPTGKMNGRGAYLCHSEACILNAQKRKNLERSLKATVPPDLYESLLAEVRDSALEDKNNPN